MSNGYSSVRTGWTRRDMLKTAAVGALVCALPRNIFAAAEKKIGISVQLYSVRKDCG